MGIIASMNTTDNPLLNPWNTPYGLPPFQLIRPEHFAPAFESAMAAHRTEIDALAGSTADPTFENTVAAFDRSGELLTRINLVFANLTSSETSPALQQAEVDLSPKIAAHQNWVSLHPGLFRRIRTLYEKRDNLVLTPEQRRLLERIHLDFVLSGANLEGQARERYAQITEELAGLYTSFSQTVLAEEAAFALELKTPEDRSGLPDFLLDAAKSAAEAKGLEGWIITLSPSLVDPFLTFSPRRDLREKVWTAFKNRGLSPDRDTRPLAVKIVRLRTELAQLMGYGTYADFALVDRMAGTPKAVEELLLRIWEPAKKKAAEEQNQIEALAAAEGLTLPLRGWDWHYYAEKVRQRDYALDEAALKPYFSLENMIRSLFEAAGRLYGLEFVEISGVPLYHPDVRLFEVRNRDSGTLQGIFLSDNFARSTKRGGAWMSEFRDQSRNRGGSLPYPIIINNNNFAKAPAGKPTLLSLDDLRTLFHEFGHGLHGLLSDVTYGRLSGTNVLRDFVELPSQINEHWALAPELLKKYALHAVTGEPISDQLVEKIHKAGHAGMGFKTVELTACALIDMTLHALPDPEDLDLMAYEARECARLGVPPAIGLRHRLPHFRHLFADSGYAAGYYVYLWAEVLEADGFEAFEETGNLFHPELAARFKKHVLSAGNTLDPREAYRLFRGRDPQVEALLRGRGLGE